MSLTKTKYDNWFGGEQGATQHLLTATHKAVLKIMAFKVDKTIYMYIVKARNELGQLFKLKHLLRSRFATGKKSGTPALIFGTHRKHLVLFVILGTPYADLACWELPFCENLLSLSRLKCQYIETAATSACVTLPRRKHI